MTRSPGRCNHGLEENRYEILAERISALWNRPRIVCVIFLYIPHPIRFFVKNLKMFLEKFHVDQFGAKIDFVAQKGILSFSLINCLFSIRSSL